MDGSIAKRYARALFEEAEAQFVDQQIYEHLGVLYRSLKTEKALPLAIINPRLSIQKKYTLLLLASGLDPEATTLYTRFLHLLLERHRETYLRLIIYLYRDFYREKHEIDRVVFETAVPVDDDTIQRLTTRIEDHTHRKAECELKVNPRIIGGFRLRIGDRRYDHSYVHQLEKIRKELLG